MTSETYTTTDTIIATTKNVLLYPLNNVEMFWRILKPYVPYIIACHVIALVLNIVGIGPHAGSGIGGLLSVYFMTCFAITWHRVVIFGPQRTTPVNPLAPTRKELEFMGIVVLLFVVMLAVVGVGYAVTRFLGGIGGLVTLVLSLAALYCALRISFIYPAKAADAPISFAQAFAMTKGYVWRIFATNFLTSLIVFIPTMIYAVIAGVIAGMFGEMGSTTHTIGQTIVMLPLDVFVTPLTTAISVTILSNFYLIAARGK
jgi:hypothetical protein